jgi:AraC-like DNA-binding protein
VLRETRRLAPQGLDAAHVAIELRTPELRFALHRGRNVSSDYALLARASPFLDRPARGCGLTVVLDGDARFEEDGRRAWLSAGDLVVNDHARRATEAHAGTTSTVLLVEWSPDFAGAPVVGPFEVARLSDRERERLGVLASAFERFASADAIVETFDLLRALGLPFERLTSADLERARTPREHQDIADAVASSLSRLDALPVIEEVEGALAMSSRTLNRRLGAIADEYALSWEHWRSAVHLTRVLSALRLLAAPGATTERVARLAGFRSAAALCHTFAAAGLPSPGELARRARRDVLASWALG